MALQVRLAGREGLQEMLLKQTVVGWAHRKRLATGPDFSAHNLMLVDYTAAQPVRTRKAREHDDGPNVVRQRWCLP